jgi:cobaltochelatase CobS subunit
MIPPTPAINERVAEAIRAQLMARAAAKATFSPDIAEPEKKVVKSLVLAAHQKKASDVLSITLRDGEDFAITVLDKAALHPQVAALIPKLDTNYTVQKDAALRMLRAWEGDHPDKVLITGPTGSGKSSLVAYCCALTNRPMIRINMTGDTESSVIFGTQVVRDGATVWMDGPATEAVLYGAVLAVDEWEVMPPEISFGFQFLLEDDGKLFLKEKPGSSHDKLIVPHKDFRMVFLGNTVGQGDDTGKYAGTNVQNTATLDRFGTTIILSYLEARHEVALITKKVASVTKDLATNMVKVAEMIRAANNQGEIGLTMSPRTLLNWARKVDTWGGDVRLAFTIAFLDKLRDNERKVVNELFNKVFGR